MFKSQSFLDLDPGAACSADAERPEPAARGEPARGLNRLLSGKTPYFLFLPLVSFSSKVFLLI